MHSYPTSFDSCRPHTCTAAHIRDVGMMMTSPSFSKSTMHLAARGLLYQHCVSILQELCFPTGHTVSLSRSPLLRLVPAVVYFESIPISPSCWRKYPLTHQIHSRKKSKMSLSKTTLHNFFGNKMKLYICDPFLKTYIFSRNNWAEAESDGQTGRSSERQLFFLFFVFFYRICWQQQN